MSKRPAEGAFDRFDVGGSDNSHRFWRSLLASTLVVEVTPNPSDDCGFKDDAKGRGGKGTEIMARASSICMRFVSILGAAGVACVT